MRRICVIGLGTIGLPTAAMLAVHGLEVAGCDIDPQVVASINAGRSHIREPGLDELLVTAVQSGRLRADTLPAEAECFLIAVPTPLGANRQPDLSHVEAATTAIAPLLRPGNLVVLESTVPVGATEQLAARLAMLRPDLSFPRHGEAPPMGCVHVAHCPERVLPGGALRELVANDRLLGGLTPVCAARARTVYARFVTGTLHATDSRMAELVKLAENTFRDVNIAFANELAAICERLGVDAWQAIAFANRHPRVQILQPGVGVGGHCIAVDPWFLAAAAPEEARLMRMAREVNDARPGAIVARIRAAAARFRRPVVACLGLTYKADLADLRNSPALQVAEELACDEAFELILCDPMLESLPPSLQGRRHVAFLAPEAALVRADIIALLVPHRAFRELDPAGFAGSVVIDAVGIMPGRVTLPRPPAAVVSERTSSRQGAWEVTAPGD